MIDCDDTNLQKLFESLEPKRRRLALRGAFLKAASFVREKAVSNLRETGIHTSKGLERGVRREMLKKKLGFRVTIGTPKRHKRGFYQDTAAIHKNKRGLEKPILPWVELGTDERYTKSEFRKRKGHYTGKMKEYGFMAKTKNQVSAKVTEELHNAIIDNIKNTAKKYGCTTH